MSDFFDKPEPTKVEPTNQEPERIKVGEAEYTQDQLAEMVGLATKAQEVEKNYGKLDKFVADYGYRANKIGQLEKELEETKKAQLARKVDEQQQMTPEELKRYAQQQAKDLGLLTQEDLNQNFDQMYVTRRAAERLVEDVESVVDEAKEKGQPATTKEELLAYMQETGIRNPQKAYKDKFEAEIEKWKEEQTKKAVMPGLFSTSSSTAGAKTPPSVPITKDNLQALLHEQLSGGSE